MREGFAIAYRMLGSVSEAEDVVQEALLRVHQALDAGEQIASPSAFVSTVTTRLAINELLDHTPGGRLVFAPSGRVLEDGHVLAITPERMHGTMHRVDDPRVRQMGQRTRYEPGTFCWVGLATSDPASAKTFYTDLFGWQAEDLEGGAAGTYATLRQGGEEVAILYMQQPEARAAGAPPHWTSYISVEDADATAARAGELGGAAVFREPFDVIDAGRVAAIRDPTGAIVSLWQPRARIGATLVNDVGALCWNELATTDVKRAKSFFAALLGWDYETDDSGYVSIINAGSRNGGMREQTEPERGTRPSWLPYFTVASANETARQAEQLGGRTLLANTEIHRGRFAAIADRQGAPFAIFEGETDP